MTQFYIDPTRQHDTWALPDAEVFHAEAGELQGEAGEPLDAGFYWWSCFPGCLPENGPTGPFATETEAIDNARALLGDE